jgi:iron-sulfur cluster assembly protein
MQVISLTDQAANYIKSTVSNADGEPSGIRIGVKKGGCAGMEYTIDLVYEPHKGDDVIQYNGATVFIEPSAVLFLLGTEMDYEITKLRSGFVFHNPNQVSACGCGESVELKAAQS